MKIADSTILVTGANRGLGLAIVEEALARGAGRVYAAARQPQPAHRDTRVSPLVIDVTNVEQIQKAAHQIDKLDILINNAGIANYDDLTLRDAIERHLAVNFFGSYEVTRAVLPLLKRSRGSIVNVLSIAALASIPVIPAYSVSKAASFSLTQGLRALLARDGITVQAALPGPLDTDMSRGLEIPKASPEAAARAIFDGIESGLDEIFPDPASATAAESWYASAAKAMERQNAQLVQQPLAS